MLVLGGLIEDSRSDTRSQVPWLGDLPGIGALFRSDTRSHRKTNLMVFLRPLVMKTQAAASALSQSRYDAMRTAQEEAPSRALPLLPPEIAPRLPSDATALPVPDAR